MRKVKFKVVYVSNGGRRHSAFASGKYNLDYSKYSIVKARKGTFGIAVFETRYQAESFQERLPYKVIRVRPIGRGKTVVRICGSPSEHDLDSFYNKRLSASLISPPGTMFYPAVEVLD